MKHDPNLEYVSNFNATIISKKNDKVDWVRSEIRKSRNKKLTCDFCGKPIKYQKKHIVTTVQPSDVKGVSYYYFHADTRDCTNGL